jgi:DNA-binding SARP family transcriptional activator
MLTMDLLGALTIRVDNQRIRTEFGSAGRRLTGYLAHYSGRPHRRERLVDLFWAGLEPNRARSALNTALWRLRKVIATEPRSKGGRNLVTLGNEVVLEPADWFEIDTHRFDASVKSILRDMVGHADEQPAVLLADALEKYSGPFLEGEDEDWILVERERLHSLYVRAAHELARLYARAKRYDEAVEIVRGVLAYDPFRETSHRDLMTLLVLNGQRAEALRSHERWCGMMRRELGISPMPRTVELMALIRSDRIFQRLDEFIDAYDTKQAAERRS